jgi:predicted dehydrogenase
LGKITRFESQYNRNSDWRNPVPDPSLERIINWRMYKEYCGGPLSELCAHQIDMINFLLNAHPEKAVGMGGINYWKDGRTTFDHVHATYEYPGGIMSDVASTLSNAFDGYKIMIFGDRGTIEILREEAYIYAEHTNNARGTVDGVTGATISMATQGKGEKIKFQQPGEELLEPTTYALNDFFRCIREHIQPASNASNGKTASIAIHMGNIAAETGQVQYWKDEYEQ